MTQHKIGCPACESTRMKVSEDRQFDSGSTFTVVVDCESCGLKVLLPLVTMHRGTPDRLKNLMAWLIRVVKHPLGKRGSSVETKLEEILAIMQMEPPAAVPCRCGAMPYATTDDGFLYVKCSGCGDTSFVINGGQFAGETVAQSVARVQGWWRMWNRAVATGSISP
jgi:Zn finger protein HypA/HybF involved in hydrogenase expression